MKKSLLLIVLCIVILATSYSQDLLPVKPINSISVEKRPEQKPEKSSCIWGIKYGISSQELIEYLLNEKRLEPNMGLSSSDAIYYTDCPFSGRNAKYITFRFVDDRLYSVVITISPQIEAQIFDLYNDFFEKLSEKYGEPPRGAQEEFSGTYYKGDGYEISAIKHGMAKFHSMWVSPSEYDFTSSVFMLIGTDVQVYISYNDRELSSIAESRKNKKEIEEL